MQFQIFFNACCFCTLLVLLNMYVEMSNLLIYQIPVIPLRYPRVDNFITIFSTKNTKLTRTHLNEPLSAPKPEGHKNRRQRKATAKPRATSLFFNTRKSPSKHNTSTTTSTTSFFSGTGRIQNNLSPPEKIKNKTNQPTTKIHKRPQDIQKNHKHFPSHKVITPSKTSNIITNMFYMFNEHEVKQTQLAPFLGLPWCVLWPPKPVQKGRWWPRWPLESDDIPKGPRVQVPPEGLTV